MRVAQDLLSNSAHKKGLCVAREGKLEIFNQTSKPEDAHKKKNNPQVEVEAAPKDKRQEQQQAHHARTHASRPDSRQQQKPV
jgi:hypothetical protein